MAVTFPKDLANYLAPTFASITIFVLFSFVLRRQVGENIFGELGFIYVGFTVAYTVIPAVGFMLVGLDDGGPLAQLLPESGRLATHLWRQVLYEVGVAVGYLLLRGQLNSTNPVAGEAKDRDVRTLVFVAALLVVCVASMDLMSAPVSSYYDHYVRYDHLPWLSHKLVSMATRLSLGLYCVLLTFMFRNYQRYKLLIPVVVAGICTHEILYSFGARIQALIVLLQAICLYHFTVRKISLKAGFLACIALTALFSAVEVVRVVSGDLDSARSLVADQGFRPSSEFLAVFFSGFHLYSERAQGALPPREWPMFFSDVISLFTFGDFTRWNPMSWYASNYNPSVEVPPFTVGPIAESAIWGGEIDLVLRSLLNGLFFAYIMRWFLRRRQTWWALTIYVYCFATCILTLKYSIFLHLSLVEKNVLPTLLLVQSARVLTLRKLSSRAEARA